MGRSETDQMKLICILLLAPVIVLALPKGCDICSDVKDEFCSLWPHDSLCNTPCGFQFDQATRRCSPVSDTAVEALTDTPIIGGSGKFRYQYMPQLLRAPPGAALVNCHGWSIDADENIILTYQNDGKDPHCLIKWNPDGTNGTFASKDTPELCGGTPHGLKITTEHGKQYLYHANNAQKLAKTTLEGEIIWIRENNFGQNDTCLPSSCPNNSCKCSGGKLPYIPTWFATPPDSKYIYLCDGYGSDHVYAFDSTSGEYMNKSWGGRSPAGLHPGAAAQAQPHGKFMENHGCTWDPRPTTDPHTIVVSDRRNMRFEFFNYNPAAPDTFDWYKTVDMEPALGAGTLPCNMRMNHGAKYDPAHEGRSIVPDLNGPVAVLDNAHNVISVVNVSMLLAADHHDHPHDATFLSNGDMIVATWAPGRLSYWKLLPTEN